jgi:hypothetical protein
MANAAEFVESELRVLKIPEYCKLRGISVRQYYSEKLAGTTPPETKISARLRGIRFSDAKADLDARREGGAS